MIPSNYFLFLFPCLKTLKKGLNIHHCECKFNCLKWQVSQGIYFKVLSPAHGISAFVWRVTWWVLTRCRWKSVLRYFWSFFFWGMMHESWEIPLLLQYSSFLSRGRSYDGLRRVGFYILLLKRFQQHTRIKTSIRCSLWRELHFCIGQAKLFILSWKSGILFSYMQYNV